MSELEEAGHVAAEVDAVLVESVVFIDFRNLRLEKSAGRKLLGTGVRRQKRVS